MKLILPVVILIFSSCSSYQYFTLTGTNISQNKEGEFVAENDTVKIVYTFNGYHGPVKISIYNKLDEPLEINWKKSALILNDQATSYYTPNLYLNGTTMIDTNRRSSNSMYVSDMTANIYGSDPSQYIPPHSALVKAPLKIPVSTYESPEWFNQKSKTFSDSKGYSFRYRKVDFDQSKSPAIVRSYLSFSSGKAAGWEFSLEHQFFVSEIWLSDTSPGYFPDILENKPDRFYVIHTNVAN